ncbi:ATP-binding protein [Brachybacterium sp. Z12]|uniref:ATP-binding protein n=1 Tax=Brachybacterium sp. Z12 TaxID=2759167 RepID=UPI00223BC3FD|nr:ATP-binding protein [Brachybacterium sp. Z12]
MQEALTNVLKHAGPGSTAAVCIHRGSQQLKVEVLDDGQGTDPASDGLGHGLTGMRERMAVLGGTLQAGPLPSRGYRVRASVPLTAALAPLADRSAPPPSPARLLRGEPR